MAPSATSGRENVDTDPKQLWMNWQRMDASEDNKRLTRIVSIEEPGMISPLMLGKNKEVDEFNLDGPQEQTKKAARRPKDRLVHHNSSPSQHPLRIEKSHHGSIADESYSGESQRDRKFDVDTILDDISVWLQKEKAKQKSRRMKRRSARVSETKPGHEQPKTTPSRRQSDASDSSVDLGGLEAMVEKRRNQCKGETLHRIRSSNTPRRVSSFRKLRRQSAADSSDTDLGDVMVPSCNAVLDNSKTLAYAGGASSSYADLLDGSQGGSVDKDAWLSFKFEIVRLTHTLRLKGWRQVPLERADKVSVERISGALTNAVYVVSPPRDLPGTLGDEEHPPRRSKPKKLLLRIYGPQVDHLIDRDAELQILGRLCKKNIGPRLLGTFRNGRFEEYLNAKALKPQDLRDPQTSVQIAKRMRELHHGIDLLQEERDKGPFVWQNWDKWVNRVEKIVTFIDSQVLSTHSNELTEYHKRRGLVCGVEWPRFRAMVEHFRKWLEKRYGGPQSLRDNLVFAHNDTQYGNILRLEPSGESPLLLPANVHRQLVVIDFEYANANTPGFDIVNHFSEWCYNYHDAESAHICDTSRYPTPEEQRRFVGAYLRHRPHFASGSNAPSGGTTPQLGSYASAPSRSNSVASALASFATDARVPTGRSRNSVSEHNVDDAAEVAKSDYDSDSNTEVKLLVHETRLWRMACSAQWTAWGIVQARVPGLSEFEDDVGEHFEMTESPQEEMREEKEYFLEKVETQTDHVLTPPGILSNGQSRARTGSSGGSDGSSYKDEAGGEEFDYLSYARDRAMWFWGDCLQLGFVREEDLPADVLRDMKVVAY